MRYLYASLLAVILFGCAGGPTHSYYSPVLTHGPKFKKPVRMAPVDDVKAETEKRLSEGYTLIGTTDYVGKYPAAVELRAQARRVHANHIIYSVRDLHGPGAWHFSFGGGFGSGGTGSGNNDVHIIFMGK